MPYLVPKTLEKLVAVSLKSNSGRNGHSTANSEIGRNRRQLLLSVVVAVVFCIALQDQPAFAQPPLPPTFAAKSTQQVQAARRSRIQAPAPRSAAPQPSQTALAPPPVAKPTTGFSIYPEAYALPNPQDAAVLTEPRPLPLPLPRPQPARNISQPAIPKATAEYSVPAVHVYPESLAGQIDLDANVELHPQPISDFRPKSRSGHSSSFRTAEPLSSTPAAEPALHIYPDGVELHDQPAAAHAATTTPARIHGRFVGRQELFGPPTGVPHIPSSGAGGHSDFADSTPTLMLPDADVSPDTLNMPAMVAVPDPARRGELLWWEADLTDNILRGRQTHPLTLPQALGIALTEAPELQVLHSDWFIQQIEVTRQDAVFDWATFVNTIWNRDSTPVGSLLDGATNRLRNRTLNAAAGLRRLNRDGSEFEVSQTIGTRSSNSTLITPNYQGNSRLAFEYQKPLLQGAGEDYNTSRVQLADIDKDTAYDRFQIGVQDHLLLVANTYWTLVLRRGRFVQAVKSWNRAQEIEQEMANRVEVDVTPTILDRTRSEVTSRLAAAIQAEHDVFAAQDALLRLIYGAKYPQYAALEVVTVTLPMKDGSQIAPENQIQTALQSRSEVHESIRQIKSASIRYNVAANEVLPVLDMVLTGYVAGLDGDYDIASAFGDQFTEGEPGVGIGFDFEIPYRNRAAEAAAEQGMIAIKRMKAQLETTISEVTEDVRGQVNERNKNGAVLPQQWETLALRKRILEHTQVRRDFLTDGVQVADLYLENLLLMQSRLEAAEFDYLQSQVRFSLADTSLLRAISKLDTIAQRDGIACSTCDSELVETTPSPTGVMHATLQTPEFTHPSQVTAASARQTRN